MDWADRADIATRLGTEEIPNDVADHAGYIADEVNLLAAQRTYELRRLGVDEPVQEAIRDMVAETIAAAYEPDNDETHHDEQDTTYSEVEEEEPAPETTAEDENAHNAQDKDTSGLNEGARASLDFIASLGLGDEIPEKPQSHDDKDESDTAQQSDEENTPEPKLHPGAQASMDFIASLGLGDTPQNEKEEEPEHESTAGEDEDVEKLNEGARASLDFLASLGLDDAPHITTTHNNNHDNEEQAPTDDLEEEQSPEL